MPGFAWGVYSSDDGHDYLLKVDVDLFYDLPRGWESPEPDSFLPQYPRAWRPRFVVGLNEAGQRREAICANTACDLWVGAATVFTYRDTDGAMATASVIERVQERRLTPH